MSAMVAWMSANVRWENSITFTGQPKNHTRNCLLDPGPARTYPKRNLSAWMGFSAINSQRPVRPPYLCHQSRWIYLLRKTIYRYVNDCLLSARNIEYARVCRLKPRKSKPKEYKVDKKCRTGRTYADYLEHMAANPDTAVVEMDTVEGNKGGSVLLTLHFRSCSFMLASCVIVIRPSL